MSTVRGRPGGQLLHSQLGASEQIAAQIRVWLEEQQLQTGERIGTEQELADEFGVSRPTMREALRLVSAAHLIRVGRGRTGELFVARLSLEVPIAGRAAVNADARIVARLEQAIEDATGHQPGTEAFDSA